MNKEKYVDESWKEQASEEKGKLADTGGQSAGKGAGGINRAADAAETDTAELQPDHGAQNGNPEETVEVNFLNYVTSLGFQAMIFMGEVPNPVTNKVEKHLIQAKFLIDTLGMLKEKTAGNLTDQESELLENSVYELQMRYVQIAQQEGSSKGSDAR
jgi:hypothetical protein